jgi:hypothetical protein
MKTVYVLVDVEEALKHMSEKLNFVLVDFLMIKLPIGICKHLVI